MMSKKLTLALSTCGVSLDLTLHDDGTLSGNWSRTTPQSLASQPDSARNWQCLVSSVELINAMVAARVKRPIAVAATHALFRLQMGIVPIWSEKSRTFVLSAQAARYALSRASTAKRFSDEANLTPVDFKRIYVAIETILSQGTNG